MANSRDVNLRIKAQDDATRVLKGIKQAFADTAKQIDQHGKSTGGANKAYASLGKEVTGLAKTIDRAKGKIDFSKQLDAVAGAVQRVSADFDASKLKLSQYAAAHEEAKKSVAEMRKELEAQKDAHGKTKTELSAASGAVSKYSAALDRAEKNIKKYSTQIATAETKAEGLRTKLAQLKTEQDKLNASDKHAATVADNLKRRIDELRRAREEERKVAVPRVSQKAGVTAEARQGMLDTKAGNLALFDRQIADVQAQLDALAAGRAKAAEPLAKINQRVKGLESEIKATENLVTARKRLTTATGKRDEAKTGLAAATAEQARLGEAVAKSEATIRRAAEAMNMASQDASKLGMEKGRLASETEKLSSKTAKAKAELEALNAAGEKGGLKASAEAVSRMNAQLERQEARLRAIAELYERQARYADGAGGAAPSQYASQLRSLNEQLRRAQSDSEAFRAKLKEISQEAMGMRMNPRIKAELREMQMYLNAAEADSRQLRMQLQRVGQEAARAGQNKLQAWKAANNESRTALSLYQRLRGQVLSMIGAYVGLFGAISAVRGITQAYMQQEAALSRLGVVFDGNYGRMGRELDWIRREANRLGIEFGTLADQYTKFAVAGKMSNFSEAGTRQIFTSVSESARVNKLSLEEIKGVYLALSQMISKGKISAEELRQQLGERLPGAMNLMAEAFGVTVSELDDMMKKGKALATEENMLKFANVLTDKFGKQLPTALQTFTTEWGRLQNTIFNAKITAGRGGLIDSLTEVMRNLNEWAQSKEGTELFLNIGHAMGQAASWLPGLIKNFELLFTTIKAIIALALSRWILGLGASMLSFTQWCFGAVTGLQGMSAAMTTVQTRAGVMGLSLAKATTAVRVFRTALLSLGPLAVGVVAASALTYVLGDWSDGVDSVSAALVEHDRIMDGVLSKYDEAKKKSLDWRDAITQKNRVEASANLGNLRNADADARSAVSSFKPVQGDMLQLVARINRRDMTETEKELATLVTNIQKNINTASKSITEDWLKALAAIQSKTLDDNLKKQIGEFYNLVKATGETGLSIAELMEFLREVGEDFTDASNFSDRFKTSLSEMAAEAEGIDKASEDAKKAVQENFIQPIEDYLTILARSGSDAERNAALMALPFENANLPASELLRVLELMKTRSGEVQEAFRKFAEDKSLETITEKLGWMRSIPGLATLFDKFIAGGISGQLSSKGMTATEFEQYIGTTKGNDMMKIVQASAKVAEAIGVSAKDLLTVISYETGGTFDKWKAGGAGGAHRGLIQWSPENIKQYGLSESSTIEQQMAQVGKYLVDRGVKQGMGLVEMYAAVNAGHVSRVNASDANNGGRPGSVIHKVNNDMDGHKSNADGLLKVYGDVAEYGERLGKAERDAADKAKDKAKEQEKLNEKKKEELTSVSESLRIETMRKDGKEREAFIEEKMNSLKKSGVEYSKEELETLRKQFGELYDIQNAKSKSEQHKEQEKKHQEEINRLETERNALLSQREMAVSAGDTDKVGEIDTRLIEINAQLDAAIQRFIEFWKAAGGPEAAAAIAQLEATQMELKQTSKTAIITADQINQQWAGGIADAFGAMAEALANGENGIKGLGQAFLKFASDFLIQIGKMIIQQTILNALQGMGGAGSGGFGGMILGALGSVTSGVFHTGKAAGASSNGVSRSVPAALFANAPRFHQGKLPGLRPGEMAAIIEQEEEVLAASHPRHAKNFAKMVGENQGSGSGMGNATIVNAFDAESFLQAGLSSPSGRKLFMNFVKANKGMIKGALGA